MTNKTALIPELEKWGQEYEPRLVELIDGSQHESEREILICLLEKKFKKYQEANRLNTSIVKWGIQNKTAIVELIALARDRDSWETLAGWLVREYDKANPAATE